MTGPHLEKPRALFFCDEANRAATALDTANRLSRRAFVLAAEGLTRRADKGKNPLDGMEEFHARQRRKVMSPARGLGTLLTFARNGQ
jgi:hypothetical protein